MYFYNKTLLFVMYIHKYQFFCCCKKIGIGKPFIKMKKTCNTEVVDNNAAWCKTNVDLFFLFKPEAQKQITWNQLQLLFQTCKIQKLKHLKTSTVASLKSFKLVLNNYKEHLEIIAFSKIKTFYPSIFISISFYFS